MSLEKILSKTHPKKSNKHYKGRKNLSFASKFCHFTSRCIFEGNKDYEFGYSIFDNVMFNAVKVYADFFGIKSDLTQIDDSVKFYKGYQKTIDEIIDITQKDKQDKINRMFFLRCKRPGIFFFFTQFGICIILKILCRACFFFGKLL